MIPTIAITIRKYIHAIAVLVPFPSGCRYSFEINFIIVFESVVNESMTVYTALTRIIGLIIGNVIFQKVSHEVAPSIWHDS